jgi:hypothetical protein
MKHLKLLLVILLAMYSQQGMAQLEKGNLLIGGTAGFDVEFEENNDNFLTIAINPMVARMVTDNVAFGGSLGLVYLKVGDFSTSSFNVMPLVRYYVPGAGNAVLFIEAKAGLARMGSSFSGESSSESAFQFSFGPGIAFFIADNVSIDALLAYNRIGGDFDQSSFGLNIGFQVFLASKE